MGARVAELVRYVVKGCAGESLDRSAVGRMGLVDDRLFMVVDKNGKFVTQRTRPQMAVIKPKLGDGTLTLSAPGFDDLTFDFLADGERLEVLLFKWTGKAVDQGAAPAEWFSQFLGEPCRLVRVPPDHERRSSGLTQGYAGFADAHALHVTSLSSLDHLNGLILEKGGETLPMNRFRPNIVISGWDEPYTEDRVRQMTVGPIQTGWEKKAVRCVVPTVDQATGHKTGPEPTKTLAGYRREEEGGVSFGAKFAVMTTGELTTGDPVEVTAFA
ncbi:MOSC N-terminal beta barrel domain-containing protein [Kibdelosporangium philippinense]|uniref:MOSC N-terminal beta barrel domain-containing protein n=1 Tax=Kibdelosporangium philippinense TaxID=211113 RepID=A0ABS8ZE21_9PSEU|nr:MOSC N-terminal beta barrel domain-containing protein [Kibdelosporangium philippinense]MCE7005323.1 MOSC N-terminal beta barrel domain-containing protein [Kibdelosporangium philippinense]